MKIGEGTDVIVRNSVTRQWARAHIQEAFGRGPAIICYGELGTHEIWLPRTHGRMTVPARPTCIVVCQAEATELIESFSLEHKGLPVYLVDTPTSTVGVPVLNVQRNEVRPRVAGPAYDRDAMLRRAVAMVDMFVDWKRRRAAAFTPAPVLQT